MSDLNFDIVIRTSCAYSFKQMKYIMHIFAQTVCVLNTDHGAFKLMKYMYEVEVHDQEN